MVFAPATPPGAHDRLNLLDGTGQTKSIQTLPRLPTIPEPTTQLSPAQHRRTSIFTELDVDRFSDDEDAPSTSPPSSRHNPARFRSTALTYHPPDHDDIELSNDALYSQRSGKVATSGMTAISKPHPRAFSSVSRAISVILMFAIFLPLLHGSRKAGYFPIGVSGGLIRDTHVAERSAIGSGMVKRADDPLNYCTRWSQQSAVVNGTLYLYGGHASQESQGANQETDSPTTPNTWNNDFLTLPLTKTWQVDAPSLSLLPQPSGPPNVSNGYLWNSYTSLFLYGGEYSDEQPSDTPAPLALWEYSILSSSWIEHKNPQTSAGDNSDGGNQPVQNAAEGAGISVPELGRGWYFGGHLDYKTTAGWSIDVARLYLKSLIEYTFPGYANTAVQSLSGGQLAGSDGVWRNVTQGGLQNSSGFPERADGVLTYIPGFGQEGLLLGLAGGTNETYTELNEVDVYDIANSTWYKQATSGPTPGIRVSPCVAAASAPDGSSINVYMFAGQNLVPYDSQEQYDDMWILTIPSFTWIKVDTAGQSVPPPRAGHTCNMWDGQMVVVGGLVPKNITCDNPGIYVFDASELKWQNQFTSLSGGDSQAQQASQSQNSSGLSGSFGYQVPVAVQSVIGGNGNGSATVTAPAVTPTSGPLATGKPITYTVTGANGATVTETGAPGSVVNGSPNGSSNGSNGPNVAAIVAGTVAGCLAILAGYLGFCIYVYRRQLALYKNHVAMSQRAAAAGGRGEKAGFLFPESSLAKSSTDQSSGPRGPASGSGTGTSTGRSGQASDHIGAVPPMPGVQAPVGGNSEANSSTEDLMTGQEPSFMGVLLNPRRSLRVINKD